MDHKRIDGILFFTALIMLAAALAVKAAAPFFRTPVVFSQWWQNELEADTLESMVREFEGLYPEIRIRLDTRPYGEIRDRLGRYLTGKTPEGEAAGTSPEWRPDVLGLDQKWLSELIGRGMLEPLEAYPGAGEGFVPEPRDERQAVHMVSLVSPLYYNIDMLRAAGFNHPPKTRAEFISYAKVLVRPGRSALILALDPADSRNLYRDVFSWFWASGTRLTGGGEQHFVSPPFIETLAFLDSLYQEGLLSGDIFTTGEAAKLDAFINRRTAMMIGSVQHIETLRKSRVPGGAGGGDFFGITTIPVPGSYTGGAVFALEDWYAGIPRTSRHKKEAWMWLAFLARRRSFLAGRTFGALPGTGNRNDPLYAKAADIYELGKGSYEPLNLEELPAFETIFLEELKALFEKARTPEAAAAEMQRRWDMRAAVKK